jgi:hypothetical protein
VILREASDDEKLARDALCHDAWGGKLTVDEFVAREARLRAHRWAAAAMTSWHLVEDGAVLASCETFAMDSFLDGARGITHGVASVYTEPRLRGRGYAGRMMSLVREQLRGHASILFSDVGDYYARFGWRLRPAIDRRFAAAPGDPAAPVDALLDARALDAAWDATPPPPSLYFVVWPSSAQLDWPRERERAYAELLGRAPLSHAGARAGDGLVAWAADFKNDQLLVLALVADDPRAVRPLVEAAQRQAHAAGLLRVIAWETPGWPDEVGERVVRSDSLPAILPLTDGLDPAEWTFIPRGVWV